MSPDVGTVMVLVAILTDCPAASVYGPVTTAADTSTTVATIRQDGMVTLFVFNVTAPFCANARPSSVALPSSPTDVYANMFPLKTELPPIVAELPTCQKTLQALAPL